MRSEIGDRRPEIGDRRAVLPLEALDRASSEVQRLRQRVAELEAENAVLRERPLREERVKKITIREVDHTAGCYTGSGLRETERRTGSLLRRGGGL